MKLKRILLIIIPVALVALVATRLIKNKKSAEKNVFQYDKTQVINVKTQKITLQELAEDYTYSGTFEPNKETKLSAEVQGKINSVLVDAGSYVTKGQTLIQLDNALLKLQLQAAEVQVEGFDADVKRYTILANADAVQRVQLEKSELALKAAKIQQATLTEQINKTSIKAPFDGIVTAKLTEEGAFAAPGMPLLQITDISQLRFTVNVPESEIKKFKVNQIYEVKADVIPENTLKGKIALIGSKANMGSSFPVQFIVANTADMRIKSGMFGKAIIANTKQEKGLVIPSSAVQGSALQPKVYLVKNGKAALQNISILSRTQNKVVIGSGLTEGDVLITNGFINLFEGANVTAK